MCQTPVHWSLTMVRNLNLICVNNNYKEYFCQLNLHVMSWSIVQNPSLPSKNSWAIKFTAVNSQWLLKSF